jgi:hypothetical protein
VKRPYYFPRPVATCVFLLGALQIAVLLVSFERPAQAYVDPGSGFFFLQIAGSMFAGAIYYMRHRLKLVIASIRRPAQPSSRASQTEAAENQP